MMIKSPRFINRNVLRGTIYVSVAVFAAACSQKKENSQEVTSKATDEFQNLVQYVDPMIGTAKMGHTYPGATAPFGSVQLSPDTDTIPYEIDGHYNPDVYKYCAGYQYDDATIVGFSHTHFSGTGHSDLGDFLIMPMCRI